MKVTSSMFFGYPIGATAENWLHDCLVEILTEIHTNFDDGVPSKPWPDIIPEAYRDELHTRTGLRDKLNNYSTVVGSLTSLEREQILTCLTMQNRIGALCSCLADCDIIDHLPPLSHNVITELFDTAFSLLTRIGIRDRHYRIIFEGTKYHVCPFCGCEYFDAPGAPREDLDHYLPKSLYPFAAANLHNLVPMGARCNQRYKQDTDMLRDSSGVRRRIFDPYVIRSIEICLTNSILFARTDKQLPGWVIEFVPDSPECSAWDEVFKIKERIQRDVLDVSFHRWLREFASWFKRRFKGGSSATSVESAMLIYAEDTAILGFNAREFLKLPVFQLLHLRFTSGDTRLRDFMIDLVS